MSVTSLITTLEGFSPTMYNDSGDKPTIGYGHLITSEDKYDKHTILTEEEAKELLLKDIETKANIRTYVKRDLTDNQLTALTSFVFNVGLGNFANSTLCKLINGNEDLSSSKVLDQFARWRLVNGWISKGLVKRRLIELYVFADKVFDIDSELEPSKQWEKEPMFYTDENWHNLDASLRRESINIYNKYKNNLINQ